MAAGDAAAVVIAAAAGRGSTAWTAAPDMAPVGKGGRGKRNASEAGKEVARRCAVLR